MALLLPWSARAAVPPTPPRVIEAEQVAFGVRIDEAPATLPRDPRSQIQLSGLVSNRTDQPWTDLNVYATVTTEPITQAADLAAIDPSAGDAELGMRRLVEGDVFVGIGDLLPGQQRSFTLRFPRSVLGLDDRAGVHLLGVQVLGSNEEGRDVAADGSARVAVPSAPARTRVQQVSLVLPFRAPVRRYADERLREPVRWARLLGEEGRLDRLLSLAESSADRPVSLLVDPAVLDAVGSLAADVEAQGAAEDNLPQAWLDRFEREAAADTVLGLGYADPDVSALSARDPELLTTAYATAEESFAARGIEARRVAAPPSGLLPDRALADLPEETTSILRSGGTRSGVRSVGESGTVVFADSGIRAIGVDDAGAQSQLAVRQRILSEALLASLAGGSATPIVAMLPPTWMPGARDTHDDFFGGLDQPWLDLTGLPATGTAELEGPLPWTTVQQRGELGAPDVAAARGVLDAGRAYAAALVDPEPVLASITRLALEPVSVLARRDRVQSRANADEVRRSLARALDGVRIEASDFVTMGREGTIVIGMVNDLAVPVRLGIAASSTSDRLRIESVEPQELQPGQRTTLRLDASADDLVVADVTLRPVTAEGTEVGLPAEVTVRSSNVGLFVWGVMGAAGLVLVGAVVRRLVRRGLHTRAQEAP